jgi:pyrimidine-nucleoside phosphorylase
LGHTGGTLDKLESIPGFRVDLSVAEYRAMVRDVGACLIGQTATLAPADKKLYALRDVTATVDCIPLIASSIMSKKLAEGIDALVLDVKVGSGAFMKTLADARTLATTMINIGREMNKQVIALLTEMDQPLGRTIGNSLEVIEAVEMLRNQAPADYTEVTMALTAEMLVLGGVAKTPAQARMTLQRVIDDGSAERKLCEIVRAQGGDPSTITDLGKLPKARSTTTVVATGHGFVTSIHSEAMGLAAMALGAGREKTSDRVDPAVGFVLEKKVGDPVSKGEPLVTIHFNDAAKLDAVKARVIAAYGIGPVAPPARPLIIERLT